MEPSNDAQQNNLETHLQYIENFIADDTLDSLNREHIQNGLPFHDLRISDVDEDFIDDELFEDEQCLSNQNCSGQNYANDHANIDEQCTMTTVNLEIDAITSYDHILNMPIILEESPYQNSTSSTKTRTTFLQNDSEISIFVPSVSSEEEGHYQIVEAELWAEITEEEMILESLIDSTSHNSNSSLNLDDDLLLNRSKNHFETPDVSTNVDGMANADENDKQHDVKAINQSIIPALQAELVNSLKPIEMNEVIGKPSSNIARELDMLQKLTTITPISAGEIVTLREESDKTKEHTVLSTVYIEEHVQANASLAPDGPIDPLEVTSRGIEQQPSHDPLAGKVPKSRKRKARSRRISKKERKPPKTWKPVQPYKCDTCEYTTMYKTTLARHIRKHTGQRSHRCEICQKSFTERTSLNRHMKLHGQLFSFQCSNCRHGFSQKEQLDLHENHCTIKQFECYVCHKKFHQNHVNLIVHMRRKHSGEMPYTCHKCGWRFCQESHIKRHTKVCGQYDN